jgi:hypothetical protein
MHESTQKLICRVGFLLLCLVPTTAVLGWGIARKMPGHVHQQEQQLSDLLGLRATVTSVSHPRPGAMLYEGLRLADPETGDLVLRCRLLEIEQQSGGMTVTASQPEIHAVRANRLERLLARWLRHELSGEGNIQLHARELTWRIAAAQGSETAVTLTAVQGLLQHSATGAEAQVSFQIAGQKTEEPIELRLARTRQSNPPTTEFTLKTGGTPLPCVLLNLGVDAAGWLGAESRFRGILRAVETPQGWNGDLQGAFTQVDLQTLVSERFPHQLTGPAEIQIERALFHDGRLTEAALELSAGPGVISRSLLFAAIESLQMETPESYPPRGALAKYEKLDLKATLDAEGLRITGQADPRSPGALMFDSQRVLLYESRTQPQPVMALLRMLVPSNEVQVPASRETQWLIERLPVPQVMRPKNADGSEPRPVARPRFGGAVEDEKK